MAQILPRRRSSIASADLYARIKPFYFDKVDCQAKQPKAVQARKELTDIHKERLKYYAKDPEKQDLLDAEFLASQLADREAQAGESVYLRDGSYTISKVFAAGGGYILFLSPNFKATSTKGIPKLVCRGTAARWSAQEGLNSVRNDLTPQIARLAVITNFSTILLYLRSLNVTQIDILGKSMGGAVAQQLAVLLEYASDIKVNCLTTVCSVGVGAAVNDFFNKHVLTARSTPITIKVVRVGGSTRDRHAPDYIPLIGGVHLGYDAPSAKCDVKIVYLGANAQEITLPDTTLAGVALAKAFLASFAGGHTRQTTLLDFGVHVVKPVDIKKHLAMGDRMEGWRSRVVTVLNARPWPAALVEPFPDFAARMQGEVMKRASSTSRRASVISRSDRRRE
jgi:pimeloyl-ACP methyl ester carboxylesterase